MFSPKKMGLSVLRRVFLGPPPTYETHDEVPEAKQLRRAIRQNDVDSALDFFLRLRRNDECEFFLEKARSFAGRPKFFKEAVAAHPTNGFAHLLKGSHGLHWAWEARSSFPAKMVSNQQFSVFRERLDESKADLEKSAELKPDLAAVCSEQIQLAIGLELSEEYVRHTLARATLIDPHVWEAHVRTLMYYSERWHGSHQAMFQFADEVTNRCADGSGLWALVPRAHFDRWQHAWLMDEDYPFASTYWQQDYVREEIIGAFERWIAAENDRRTLASQHLRSRPWENRRVRARLATFSNDSKPPNRFSLATRP